MEKIKSKVRKVDAGYKLEMSTPDYNEVRDIIKKYESHLPENFDYVKKYQPTWRTLTIEGKFPPLNVKVAKPPGYVRTGRDNLFSIYPPSKSSTSVLEFGGARLVYKSFMKNKKYIFGREYDFDNRLYYLRVKGEDVVKRISKDAAPIFTPKITLEEIDSDEDPTTLDYESGYYKTISRIQSYIKNEEDEKVSITNLGLLPIQIEIEKDKLLI